MGGPIGLYARAGDEFIISVGGDDVYGGNGNTGAIRIELHSSQAMRVLPPLLPPPEPEWRWNGVIP